MNDNAAAAAMPAYRSHKIVYALQIATVESYPNADTSTLIFSDTRYAPRSVDNKMFVRYAPLAGDYFVVYGDGYQSISPRKAFEDGYTLVQP